MTGRFSDQESWAHANEMVNQHGFEAPIHAAMKADDLFEQGDFDGARDWVVIVRRINEILRGPGGEVN